MEDRIIKANAIEEMRKDTIKYSIKVNRQRMIPDVRDGLKPVHRRILDNMYNHVRCTSHTVKCARIVGSVIGISHPHGDISVYDAMKPMANWFEIKEPLIEAQGSFGSEFGDSASAMRYTEAKISRFGMDAVIGELKEEKSIVDWMNTFDDSNKEPEFFPVMVPLLLVNGSFGIGFGMKTEIPSHNLGEVIDQTIKLIKNPNADVLLVPDHCAPVEIIDTNFKAICNKGWGSYSARGIIDIEDGPRDTKILVIKSLPDRVFMNRVEAQIEKLALSNTIAIADMSDESEEGKPFRYTIKLKKGMDPVYARDIIYKRTSMQSSYTVNFEVLDKLEPVRMSYKQYLLSFIEFRKLTKFRLFCNRLQNFKTKYHEKEAFIKLLQSGDIDNIINMIKNRKDTNDDDLIEYLIKKLKVTDLQAKYIINANLKSLSIGYLNKYMEEAKRYSDLIEDYTDRIIHDERILEEIIEELKYFKKTYGRPRISKVISNDQASEIPEGEFKVIVTENNFIKKLPVEFDNGRFKEDKPQFIIKGSNTKAILLFDENGKVFRLPIHQILISDKSSNGIDVRKIIKHCTSNIIAAVYEPDLETITKSLTKHFVTVLSSNGSIKKMDVDDFMNIPKSGILYTKLDQGQKVIDISLCTNCDVVVYNKQEALRMSINDIPHQRRNTKGMKSLFSNIAEGMSLIYPNDTGIIVVTDKGYVNRIDMIALPALGRNRAGVNVINLGKGDSIKSIQSINPDSKILKVKLSSEELIEIPIENIKTNSSIAKGDRLLKIRKEEIISVKIK